MACDGSTLAASSHGGYFGDDQEGPGPLQVVLTATEVLNAGLKLAGYTERRVNKVKKQATNDRRFKDHFGCHQVVAAQLFEDLQTTKLKKARLDQNKVRIEEMLKALHFLKRYPKECQREADYDRSKKVLRDWAWYYIQKISHLMKEQVIFPNNCPDIWIMSVDGMHVRYAEPTHPILSQNRKYGSHKYKKAAMNFEFGLALDKSECVHCFGPFRGGETDLVTFKKRGLVDLVPAGKKIIGDGIYKSLACASAPNRLDHPAVAKFKRRARMRHEKYHAMLKEFECLDCVRFRHKKKKLQMCCHAVVVVTQYQMKLVSPLFDILADGSNEALAARELEIEAADRDAGFFEEDSDSDV
jgi:hypothetical protein